MPTLATTGNQLIFIDARLFDLKVLRANLPSDIEVVLLDAAQNGLAQIAATVAKHTGIDAIHIFSHGSVGALQLGDLYIDAGNISDNAEHLAVIGNAMAAAGDILLYGCDVAAGTSGADFIGRLALVTGADVAASDDLTGGTSAGGNWILESSVGLIAANARWAESGAMQYQHLLAAVTLTGGNDTPALDTGNDTITANVVNSLNAGDVIDGLAGTDTLNISASQSVTLGAATLSNVEQINITAGAQVITSHDATVGAGQTLTIDASVSTATFRWDGVAETDGNFHITSGSGNDTVTGGAGNDTIYGGAGNDRISGVAGDNTIDAGDGADFVYGMSGAELIYGGAGNDGLSGGGGNDTMWGGADNDTIIGGAGDDLIYGDDGIDLVWAGDGDDTVSGGDGNDNISGDAGNDVLYGGNDNDILRGFADNDILYGDAGTDTLSGGIGADTLYGGADADIFQGTAAELDGDTVADFATGDSIVVTGSDLSALNGTAGSSSLDLGSGRSLSLTGISAITNSFAASYSSGNTTITLSAPVVPTPDEPPGTIVDGATVRSSVMTAADGTVTLITDVAIISASREESSGAAELADIPLVSSGGETVLLAGLPAGVGLRMEATEGSGGMGLAGLTRAIESRTSELGQEDDRAEMVSLGTAFLQNLPENTDLLIRTLVLSAASSDTQIDVPIVISGSSVDDGTQVALVIDTRSLPPDIIIQLDNVEFATILGTARITGGAGPQVVMGDGADQFMVLGENDDILFGGGGADTVASKAGHDMLYGDQGNDWLVGGAGDDTLDGGTGNDVLQGGHSDAGNWAFQIQDGQLVSQFAARESVLTEQSGLIRTGPWSSDIARNDVDDRLAFSYQLPDRLKTIAALHMAATGRLPELDQLNGLSTGALSEHDLAEVAVNYLAATLPDLPGQPVELKVRALIENVWGETASDALVETGVNFLEGGGSWAEALLYLALADKGLARISDADGNINLTALYNTGESGWSSDSGDDVLRGGDGNDRLVGGGGHDILDGGGGTDVAVFAGNVANYSFHTAIVEGEGRIVITNKQSGDVDILKNVELLQIGSHYYGPDSALANLEVSTEQEIADYVVKLTGVYVDGLGLAA